MWCVNLNMSWVLGWGVFYWLSDNSLGNDWSNVFLNNSWLDVLLNDWSWLDVFLDDWDSNLLDWGDILMVLDWSNIFLWSWVVLNWGWIMLDWGWVVLKRSWIVLNWGWVMLGWSWIVLDWSWVLLNWGSIFLDMDSWLRDNLGDWGNDFSNCWLSDVFLLLVSEWFTTNISNESMMVISSVWDNTAISSEKIFLKNSKIFQEFLELTHQHQSMNILLGRHHCEQLRVVAWCLRCGDHGHHIGIRSWLALHVRIS